MSTRSRIGIETYNGIRHIYCHFDGYPEGVGKVLLKHYKTEAKILELMDLGDISFLGQEIGEKHDFDRKRRDWCMAYHRDRGDPLEQVSSVSVEAFYRYSYECWAEYIYLWRDNKWHWTNVQPAEYSTKEFKELKQSDVE